MKKAFLMLFLLIYSLTSCVYYYPTEELKALATEAIYSAFGYNGTHNDFVQIIEKDNMGRILYSFNGNYHGFSEANHDGIEHMLICQYIDYDNNYVYYYPVDNFIIYSVTIKPQEKKVDKLKELNDWNREINISKCIKKKINPYKEEKEFPHIQKIVDNFYYKEGKRYYTIFLCDKDKNGLELYAACVYYDLDDYKVFAIIIDPSTESSYKIIEIPNHDYIDKINNFKETNNWEYKYCEN